MSQQDLFQAIRSGDLAAASTLLSADPALVQARNEQGISAVLMACYTGRKEIRDLLIAKGARLELHEATAAGNVARVKELVEPNPASAKGFSPDGFPLLALAAAFGHEDVARYLHSKGADLNAVSSNGSGYNALTGAVAGNHVSIVRWLAENGADVNYRYAKGHSPFLEAAANGNVEILKLLVAHGADVHVRSDDGRLALAMAEQHNRTEAASYLRSLSSS